MQISLNHLVASAVEPTPNVLEVAAMFGLGIDRDKHIQLIPETELNLSPGRIVFITGSSGGGKTTLLRLIREQIDRGDTAHALSFDNLPVIPDRPLVDCFPGRTLGETLRLLSLAGLNDAFVMLRKPSQLSDGQRYRLKLAQAMAMAEAGVLPSRLKVILADEFCATLDRVTAKVIAHNVRKWVSKSDACFIAATTHDDLLESLAPDVLIEKHPGERMDVLEKSAG
ncbi:MAG: ATP-binding cassette domain-containing protein [Phycisphaerales bacterium]